MSLRKQAKILEITPAYLSMLVNGKRRWQPDLYERYCELVNTVNSSGQSVNNANASLAGGMERETGFEPATPCLEVI